MNTSIPASRPNMVLILADDMGFSDIGCYGSEIHTPSLDRLAAGGIRFTQMYNYARCCPTRACLLTGLYPHQAGVGHMVSNDGLPQYQGYLRDDCATIGEVLRSGGYRTMLAGKWHVGGIFSRRDPGDWRIGDPERPLPLDRGFDEWYGTPAGAGSYFNPRPLFDNDTIIEPPGEGYYYTDAVSDRAVQMIEKAAGDSQPFFLHVCYTAPHWPLHAFEEDIARYQGTYRAGWDAVRTARHETLKGLGILDARWDISPRDEQAPDWGDIEAQAWEDRRMAVYAAQIDRMDQGIGRIVDKLRELDILHDTLIVFLSDNGGCAELLREDGQRGREWQTTLDGRLMRFGNIPDLMPGDPTTYQSYDLPWANVSNTPFRLYKHWVHEGGIATPMIAHWPACIEGARISHEVVHIIDMMATCIDVAGVTYPETVGEHTIQPLEGESFYAALRGEAWRRERPLFWEHEGNCAVRDGRWKLVRKHPGDWELYDMVVDRTELADLAARNKPQVAKMVKWYQEWAERIGVLPWERLLARRTR
ncbi:MAG: arylsulfatase [Anaerolineae bacterium]|nr:arylsulfatase [Anaerolineae bacterium]